MLILTNALQETEVRKVAHMLPPENIFAEPAKRDTAPAVALGIGLVAARDPKATMAVLPSDQLINDTESFQSVLEDSFSIASQTDALVT
ncbi:sugar phosphate nucleotidyltransferase, partial [Akkermansiaceae bacterium]|nr:sugar phosphate nucleotidyltransferase [Akkermansiaceae bacterium]